MGRAPLPVEHGYDEEGRPIFGRNDEGVPVCYARKKRSGDERCMSVMRLKNGRCRNHGGALAGPGPDHHLHKHGLFSKVMPKKAFEKLQEMANDPELLQMRTDIAFQDTRQLELLEAIYEEGGTTKENWTKIVKAATEMAQVIHAFENDEIDPFSANDSIATMGKKLIEAIMGGSDQRKLQEEFTKVSLVRAKLIETELKRKNFEISYMPADQVISLFVDMMKIVRRRVSAKHERDLISQEIDELSADPKHRRILGGDPGASGTINPHSKMGDIVDMDDFVRDMDALPDNVEEAEFEDLD